MDGRSATILIALAFVATGLAGCIQNPLASSSTEVSAFEHKDKADAAALLWSPTAKIVGAMAFELSQTTDPRIVADPDPGNGLAPAWWYVYCDDASNMSMRAFKVTANGTVSSEKDAEAMAMGMSGSAAPLGTWTIDSSKAIDAAKTNATFAKAARGFNASVVEGVAKNEGVTSWWVSAMSADGFVVATVDAATGKLLDVKAMDLNMKMPDFQWGAANPTMMAKPVHLEGNGTLAGGDTKEFPFKLDEKMPGYLDIMASTGLPTGRLEWSIVDKKGETVVDGSAGSFQGGADKTHTDLDALKAGEYKLVLSSGDWLPMTPVGGGEHFEFVLHLDPAYKPSEKQ